MGPARPNSAISRLMETARLRQRWRRRHQDGDGASQNVTKKCHFQTFAARPKSATSRLFGRGGDGAVFTTKVETTRLRQKSLAVFAIEVETAQIWQPKWRRRDSNCNGATGLAGATKNCYLQTFAIKAETARLSRTSD